MITLGGFFMKIVTSKSGLVDKRIIKSVVMGSVMGIITTVIITVLCTLGIIVTGKLPDGVLDYISLFVLAAGSFTGGFISGRIYKGKGILIGVFTGLFIFLIVFISGINSIMNGVALFTAVKFIVIVFFSVFGAAVGVNKKEKLKYK